MPRLQIENFCGIKKADIEIKPFTVFIGESSTGKSVVAKLHWLFNETIPLMETMLTVLYKNSFITQIGSPLGDRIKQYFDDIFYSYRVYKTESDIIYTFDTGYSIHVKIGAKKFYVGLQGLIKLKMH